MDAVCCTARAVHAQQGKCVINSVKLEDIFLRYIGYQSIPE